MDRRICSTVREDILAQLQEFGIETHRGFYKRIIEDALLELIEQKTKFSELKKDFERQSTAVDAEIARLSANAIRPEEMQALKIQLESQKRIINKFILERVELGKWKN